MKHQYRFLGSKESGLWQISPDDIQHITRVLRLDNNETIELFDGLGNVAFGHLKYLSKQNVEFHPTHEEFFSTDTSEIHLVLGALKPGFIDDLLPSLTELDVNTFHVILQDSTAKSRISEKVIQRWQKIVTSSCKQCKRPYLPTITVWDSLIHLLESIEPLKFQEKFMLLPGNHPPLIQQPLKSKKLIAVVGSEKGFSDKEEGLLIQSGFIPSSMGQTVQRAFTAAIAATAILVNKSKFEPLNA